MMPAPSPISGSAPTAPRCSRFSRIRRPFWTIWCDFSLLQVDDEADAAGIVLAVRDRRGPRPPGDWLCERRRGSGAGWVPSARVPCRKSFFAGAGPIPAVVIPFADVPAAPNRRCTVRTPAARPFSLERLCIQMAAGRAHRPAAPFPPSTSGPAGPARTLTPGRRGGCRKFGQHVVLSGRFA